MNREALELPDVKAVVLARTVNWIVLSINGGDLQTSLTHSSEEVERNSIRNKYISSSESGENYPA